MPACWARCWCVWAVWSAEAGRLWWALGTMGANSGKQSGSEGEWVKKKGLNCSLGSFQLDSASYSLLLIFSSTHSSWPAEKPEDTLVQLMCLFAVNDPRCEAFPFHLIPLKERALVGLGAVGRLHHAGDFCSGPCLGFWGSDWWIWGVEQVQRLESNMKKVILR